MIWFSPVQRPYSLDPEPDLGPVLTVEVQHNPIFANIILCMKHQQNKSKIAALANKKINYLHYTCL